MIYHGKNADSYSLTDLDEECKAVCLGLKPHLDKFDVVAVTGLSGVLPGVGVALKLKLPLAILRKDTDDSHQGGGAWVNGTAITKGCRVLWLDDFASSGRTRKRVTERVEELGGKVVAEYLTRGSEFVEL